MFISYFNIYFNIYLNNNCIIFNIFVYNKYTLKIFICNPRKILIFKFEIGKYINNTAIITNKKLLE